VSAWPKPIPKRPQEAYSLAFHAMLLVQSTSTEDGSELVAEPEVGIPLGEGGAGGRLGDVREELGFRNTDAPRGGGVVV
jgi:hypothetical protein